MSAGGPERAREPGLDPDEAAAVPAGRAPVPLPGGGRFAVWGLPAEPPLVAKIGPAAPLAREAAALRRVAGRGVGPRLVAAAAGALLLEWLPGAPRDLVRLGRGEALALGAVVRRVHETARAAAGGLPAWRGPARSLASYRARRARDAAGLAATGGAGLARAVVGALPPLPGAPEDRPFRLLHGDLVAANVIWDRTGPRLVDWEFWRLGDPAEDLAYLVEVNRLPDALTDAVLEGYGEPGVAARLDAWRALVALDAGLWYAAAGRDDLAAPLLARAEALAVRRERS